MESVENLIFTEPFTAWKVSKYGFFSGPNAGKYGLEKTPYLDTFDALITYYITITITVTIT